MPPLPRNSIARNTKGIRKAQEVVPCDICGRSFKTGGLTKHQNACLKQKHGAAELSEAASRRRLEEERILKDTLARSSGQTAGMRVAENSAAGGLEAMPLPNALGGSLDYMPESLNIGPSNLEEQDPDYARSTEPAQPDAPTSSHPSPSPSGSNESSRRLDDIKIEYHPKSAREPKIEIFHFEDYNPDIAPSEPSSENIDQRPWRPFRSQLDFELADLMLACNMDTKEKTRLLSWIHACLKDPKSFTFESVKDIDKAWESAKYRATEFEKVPIEVEFKKSMVPLTVYARPIWKWCTSLLHNKYLVEQFHWDAERHFKFNGNDFERFIDEPWTAQAWWDLQSSLPPGASPFCIIIYADKTHLSSFGTQKGYPVYARCANLPVDIRNGEGDGGGILVGWLPIPKEDTRTSQSTAYVNFKRVVWHRAFYEILKSIEQYSKTGCYVHCGDGIVRWIWPFILMASADYEEQCTMSLIRGGNCKMPCPVCLVPDDLLSDLSLEHPLRTTESMKKVYDEALAMRTAAESDAHLKKYGLRKVENTFWKLGGCDIYQAISWDRLHAYHLGLFSDHLQEEMKRILTDIGGIRAVDKVEKQLAETPRWPGLNHFSSLKTGEFSDGTKFEDLSKVLIYSSHNVLNGSPEGKSFLALFRCYLELDMLSSLTVHTETSLRLANEEMLRFSDLLKSFAAHSEDNEDRKNWNFPKVHTHAHMVQGIIQKGVTRNYNTKVNEKCHGPLKDWYLYQSNFKEVDSQILAFSDMDLVSTIVHAGINVLNSWRAEQEQSELKTTRSMTIIGSHHASFGSPLAAQSFVEIQQKYQADPAFLDLRQKVNRFLVEKRIVTFNGRLRAETKIVPYQLLRVRYESSIDWRECTDLLRVSEMFYNRKRNDYALVNAGDGKVTFVQLLFLFVVHPAGQSEDGLTLALVLPFDLRPDSTPTTRRRDKELRFTRVRARRRLEARVISAESVIRGALLSPDYSAENPDEYIVMDLVSNEMWWRLKSSTIHYSQPSSSS